MSSDTKAYSATNQSDAACYLGFANLPNQVHRKSVKKGIIYQHFQDYRNLMKPFFFQDLISR